MIIRKVDRFELEGDGLLDSYIHIGGRVGVLVDVAGSKANSSQFVELAHDVALQVAAVSPRYITRDEVPADAIEAEMNIYRAQLAEDKKPDNIKERIIEGKLKKWYSEVTLINQEFVKENKITIGQLLKQKGKELGDNISVRRFARFELGVEE